MTETAKTDQDLLTAPQRGVVFFLPLKPSTAADRQLLGEARSE